MTPHPVLSPIERPTLSAQVARHLLALINSEQLRPGDGVPSEMRISQDLQISRGSVVGHIWSQHRPGEKRPAQPAKCPECHQAFGEGMGMHRNRIHGWSALDEAYVGLI